MNNLAIVTDENPVEVRLRATATELCDQAQDVMIFTKNDLSTATDLVKNIKVRFKEIEEERKRIVEPFNAGVKAINSRFKAMTAPLEEAEDSVKGKMLVFQKAEEKRANEEAARLEKERQERIAAEEATRLEAVEDGDDSIRTMPVAIVEAPIVPVHRPTTYGQTGAVSTVKKVWAFEVTDIAKLAAARPDLVSANDVNINREIRGQGGEIPGLRIYEKEIMQVR